MQPGSIATGHIVLYAVRAAEGERALLLLDTGTTEPVILGTRHNKFHQGRSGRADASIVIFVKW